MNTNNNINKKINSNNGKININKNTVDVNSGFKRPSLRDKRNYKDIKKLIKNQFKKYGTKYFYSHHVCHNKLEKHSWVDIYFLSKKYNNIFYNVTISTSMLLIEEDLPFNKNIKINIDELKNAINKYSIGFIKKDFSYLYGVGLDICIADKEHFILDDIYKIIEYFWDNEEKDIISDDVLGNINNLDISKIEKLYYEEDNDNDKLILCEKIIEIPKEKNINNVCDYFIYRTEVLDI